MKKMALQCFLWFCVGLILHGCLNGVVVVQQATAWSSVDLVMPFFSTAKCQYLSEPFCGMFLHYLPVCRGC